MSTTSISIVIRNDDTQDFDLPELTMIDGVAYCTSIQVAEHFEKTHSRVLKDIGRNITQVIESLDKVKFDSTEDLFKKSEYSLINNLGHTVKKPLYLLTEKGFTLLAMGYEGKKAMTFKLRYMTAFEQMRNYIEQKPAPQPTTITQEQYAILFQAIEKTASEAFHPKHARPKLVNYLKCQFNADPLTTMKFSDLLPALEYLKSAKTQISDIRFILSGMEDEAIKGLVAGNMPSLRHLKGQCRRKLEKKLGKPVNAHQILVHDYTEKNGLTLVEV